LDQRLNAGILRFSRSLGSLKDFADAPTLIAAKRPALNDQHAITDMAFAFSVMRFHFRAPPQDLFVLRMHHRALDRNDNGLLHAIADDQTSALFS
jgi:hypothetical protein